MKKIILFFALLLYVLGCTTKKEDIAALDIIKRDVVNTNCIIKDHVKFVSLFFARAKNKTIVQAVPFIGRPYYDNTVFYYKQDSSFIYVCSGFCDEFRMTNDFSKWNDSMSNQYPSCLSDLSLSDSYADVNKQIEDKYYEYDGKKFICIDSLSIEEKHIIVSQADSFRIGFLMESLIPPSPLLQLNEDSVFH